MALIRVEGVEEERFEGGEKKGEEGGFEEEKVQVRSVPWVLP